MFLSYESMKNKLYRPNKIFYIEGQKVYHSLPVNMKYLTYGEKDFYSSYKFKQALGEMSSEKNFCD